MQYDEQNDQPWAAGVDPEEWAWLRGVDYVSGWRSAKDAADTLNEALRHAGVRSWELRVVADTDAEGNGRVRLFGTVDIVGWLTEVVDRAAVGHAWRTGGPT